MAPTKRGRSTKGKEITRDKVNISQKSGENSTKEEWVLFVYWIDSNEWNVQPSSSVINSVMLKDKERIGLVEHVEHSADPPSTGWSKFKARVLSVGGKSYTLCFRSCTKYLY